MANKLNWVQEQLDELKEAGFYNNIRTLSSPQGAWLIVDGKKVLDFCSNNYLGLANHPRLVQAVQGAVEHYGVGPGRFHGQPGSDPRRGRQGGCDLFG